MMSRYPSETITGNGEEAAPAKAREGTVLDGLYKMQNSIERVEITVSQLYEELERVLGPEEVNDKDKKPAKLTKYMPPLVENIDMQNDRIEMILFRLHDLRQRLLIQ
jgi:hypothetical protein